LVVAGGQSTERIAEEKGEPPKEKKGKAKKEKSEFVCGYRGKGNSSFQNGRRGNYRGAVAQLPTQFRGGCQREKAWDCPSSSTRPRKYVTDEETSNYFSEPHPPEPPKERTKYKVQRLGGAPGKWVVRCRRLQEAREKIVGVGEKKRLYAKPAKEALRRFKRVFCRLVHTRQVHSGNLGPGGVKLLMAKLWGKKQTEKVKMHQKNQ